MSQESVYNAIKKLGKPATTKQIGKKLKINVSTIGETCRKLEKQGEINKEIKLTKEGASHPRKVAFWSIKNKTFK